MRQIKNVYCHKFVSDQLKEPRRHSYINPIASISINTIITHQPNSPTLDKQTAQGNKKITSISKITYSIATI